MVKAAVNPLILNTEEVYRKWVSRKVKHCYSKDILRVGRANFFCSRESMVYFNKREHMKIMSLDSRAR